MNKEKLHRLKRKLGWIVFFGGLLIDTIISVGFLSLKPFFHLIFAIAAGAVTLKLIGITLLKFCCAPVVWYGLFWCINFLLKRLDD